jgi:2-C-methyl-D-erythritol 2,4-cyclodiphosphate synthase
MTVDGMRIGHGYDVHRFAARYNEKKPLILAGVLVPERVSLEAHSDGDLVLHAVCDAILGALAEGDIGQHFPDDDSQYAGVDSAKLLASVLALATARDFQLINVDATVIAQVPRLSPHRQAMKTSLAELLQLPPDRVNLKATTTEGLGDIGKKLGMACHAVVLLNRVSA